MAANNSIFERTMMALQEAKKTNKTVTSKVVKENVKRKAKSLKRENEEIEEIDDEIIDANVEDIDAEGISDEVVVVTDPDMDAEEYEDAIEDAEEIIDNTPEGEQPASDKYNDDFVYTCPICGNTFFSENEMSEGDACPVCGDNPEAYVLEGEVESDAGIDEEMAEDDLDVATDDIVDAEEEVEDAEDLEEDLDIVTDVEKDAEDQTKSKEGSADYNSLSERKSMVRDTAYKLDESTFNPFLTKFVQSNYKNAKAFVVKEAFLKGRKLRLECKLFFKSGKSKMVRLHLEGFNPAKRIQKLAAKDDGAFKVESRKGATVAPFVFEGLFRNNVLKCTKMNYNFVTVKENKRFQVSGKLIKESK